MFAWSYVCHFVQHNDELLKHAKSATYVAIGTGPTQLNLKASKPQTVASCIVTLMYSILVTGMVSTVKEFIQTIINWLGWL